MTTRQDISDAVAKVMNKLIDEGKIIEAGFAAYLIVVWGKDALDNMPKDQLVALHRCYFAASQHLFSAIMNMLDPGEEPSEADLKRMDQINQELEAWTKTMHRDHYPTKGSA